jgi:hypothetical protein
MKRVNAGVFAEHAASCEAWVDSTAVNSTGFRGALLPRLRLQVALDQRCRQRFGNRFTNVAVRTGTERSVDGRLCDLASREDACVSRPLAGLPASRTRLFARDIEEPEFAAQ